MTSTAAMWPARCCTVVAARSTAVTAGSTRQCRQVRAWQGHSPRAWLPEAWNFLPLLRPSVPSLLLVKQAGSEEAGCCCHYQASSLSLPGLHASDTPAEPFSMSDTHRLGSGRGVQSGYGFSSVLIHRNSRTAGGRGWGLCVPLRISWVDLHTDWRWLQGPFLQTHTESKWLRSPRPGTWG